MAEKLGIENLKKAAKLGVQLGMQIEVAGEDGFQLTDLFGFVAPLSQLPAIIADKDALVAEFKDLDGDERAELLAYVETELTLQNKKIEKLVEGGLGILVSLLQFIDVYRESKKAEPTSDEPTADQPQS